MGTVVVQHTAHYVEDTPSLATKMGSILFRHPCVFYDPQLQIMCYIARYYVRKIARAPGGAKNISSLSCGGGQNRIDPKNELTEH